jgi:hypothetical protein
LLFTAAQQPILKINTPIAETRKLIRIIRSFFTHRHPIKHQKLEVGTLKAKEVANLNWSM